ncbi:MAG: helix-turn-helix domain-containing protein [Bacteroidota bacterium]
MNNQIAVTPRCPIRTTLELVGGKWKLLILFQLREEALRTAELKRRIPDISEKMLIQELKVLVINQLVERYDFQEQPPHVEYQLTDRGRAALPLIVEMKRFAETYDALG